MATTSESRVPEPAVSNAETISKAREYISASSVTSTNISFTDLGYLLVVLALPIDKVAELLECDPELIRPKAYTKKNHLRSQIYLETVSERPPANSRNRSPNKIYEARQRARYSAEVVCAEEYIEKHQLLKHSPEKRDYEYLYGTLGLPLNTLGRLLNRGWRRIGFDLEGLEITKRSGYEQKLRRYKLEFFKTWSPEMAWVLGLLYTDGNIETRRVTLYSTDVELLNKVGELLFTRFTLTETLQGDKRNRISKLVVNHQEMIADLRSLGLEERKSLIMKFPGVPDEFIRHFIRGCWDGDGGFTLSGKKLTAHYTCGSIAFIERVAHELWKAGIGRRQFQRRTSLSEEEFLAERNRLLECYGRDGLIPLNIFKRKSANAYDLRLAGREQLFALAEYLYKDVPEQTYLKRKYELLHQNLQEQ